MHHHDKAFVIYAKPYRETSAIIKVFSEQSGVLAGVVKGVHGKGKQAASLRSALQIGNAIEFQWQGLSSLKTIYQIELSKYLTGISTKNFLSLSYVNELLMYLLPEEQNNQNIFSRYSQFIQKIHLEIPVELLLRQFELSLLEEMGYGIDLGWDVERDEEVHKEAVYTIVPAVGVKQLTEGDQVQVSGKDLLLIANNDFSETSTLKAAKRINRLLLDYHLEGKVLKTRKLYQQLFIDTRQAD